MAIADAAAPMTAETALLRRTSTGSGAATTLSSSSWPSSSCAWRTGASQSALIAAAARSSWWCSLLSLLQRGDDPVEVVGLDEYVAGLRPFARADDPAALEDVHQPAGLGEADPELALEHGRGPELRGHDELHRLDHQVEVVADVVVELATRGRRGRDVLAVGGRELLLAVVDDLVDLGLGHPGALDSNGLRGAHRQEERVALAHQLLRTGLVEDHPAVREARGREGQPRRHVGLDESGDHVDARPLRREH